MCKSRLISVVSIISISSISMLFSQTAGAEENPSVSGTTYATCEMFIKATPSQVWKAVHDQRQDDPEIEYSKVIQDDGNIKLLEQKFLKIPMLGTVIAVTRQVEDPNKRIDYTLVRSDKFKALDGCWRFTPLKDGTVLQLSSNLDIGVPFSRVFIKMTAQKKLKHRLTEVKRLAEMEQARVAMP